MTTEERLNRVQLADTIRRTTKFVSVLTLCAFAFGLLCLPLAIMGYEPGYPYRIPELGRYALMALPVIGIVLGIVFETIKWRLEQMRSSAS